MLNEMPGILSAFDTIPKRLLNVSSTYVGSLTLITKRHTLALAGELSGLDQSRFCALLNNPETATVAKKTFNRAMRRRLKRIKRIDGRLVFIIDATILGRKSRQVENVGRYHSGSGLVWGHKVINFAVLNGNEIIPLETLPIFTKRYARENKLKRMTEVEIVEDWIKSFKDRGLFSEKDLRSALFLLDAGYDAKPIQRAIMEIGADFVAALKSSRIINGKQIAELFRHTKRWLKSEPIRLTVGAGGSNGLKAPNRIDESTPTRRGHITLQVKFTG